MSAQFSVADAEKKIGETDFPRYLRQTLKDHKMNLNKASLLIDGRRGFLVEHLRRPSPALPVLYALSMHLKVNLFEPFINQLPEHLRATQRETALQEEIAALQKQLADMTKERDIYKEVALRK